jgi:large subunit ribosomal protein L25
VSVEGLTAGAQIHAAELELPEGTSLITDPDILVINIVSAPTADELDAELAEAEAEAGIERDESDVDIEAAAEAEASTDGTGTEGADGAGSDEAASDDS